MTDWHNRLSRSRLRTAAWLEGGSPILSTRKSGQSPARRSQLRTSAPGFTLVELLVVITIIGILVGLLTPAILASRESARRLECNNRQEDLAKAVTAYELAKQQFPGFANKTPGPTAEASWLVVLLSNLDRNDLWDQWRSSKPTDPNLAALNNMRVARLVCPSDNPEEPGATSYVANCGQADEVVDLEDDPASPVSKSPPDWNANGVFHRYYAQPSSPRTTMSTRLAMTDIKDGTQHTLLLSENVQAGEWTTFDRTQTPPAPLPVLERAVGMVWCPHQDEPGHAHDENHGGINVGRDIESSEADFPKLLFARPSSYHPGGVNVAFCDGRIQFLNEQIDYEVYQLLMTPDGAKAQKYEGGAWTPAPQTKKLDEKMLLTN